MRCRVIEKTLRLHVFWVPCQLALNSSCVCACTHQSCIDNMQYMGRKSKEKMARNKATVEQGITGACLKFETVFKEEIWLHLFLTSSKVNAAGVYQSCGNFMSQYSLWSVCAVCSNPPPFTVCLLKTCRLISGYHKNRVIKATNLMYI